MGPVSAMTSRTGLEPQTFQVGNIALEILHCEILIDVVRLKEAVDLVAGFKAKQAPQIWLIEMTQPEFLRQQGLQGAAGESVVPAVAKPFGDVIGNVDCEFHCPYLTLRCFRR